MVDEDAGTAGPLRRLERYELHGAIASGGMARVHFGRLLGPSGFSRTVAIKRLHPQLTQSEELVAMLLDEAKLVARIQHPNVVSTIDMVADGGELFVVMEYVPGESVSRLMRLLGDERMPLPIVTSIACGMLHGLHAAHSARSELDEPLDVVHRDVSPHNVLVGVDGLSRVLDFGVAKARGRVQSTRAGQVKGKLAYLAPEQILCEDVSPRTDVYAASVVVWEMLTGRRLFDATNEGALLHRVLESSVEAPSAIVPGLPRSLDSLVLRGLARDPAARFASALELAVAIEQDVGIAPVHRVAEWIQRAAAEPLAARASQLAAIERASIRAQTTGAAPARQRAWIPADASSATAVDAAVATSGATPAATETQLSNLSVVTSAAETSPRVRRRAPAVVLVSLLAGGAAVIAWSIGRYGGAPASSGADPQLAAPVAASAPAPSGVADTSPGAEPSPSTSVSASTEPARPAREPEPVKTHAGTTRPRAPAPATASARAATPPPADDCNPPYVLGADGLRRWKRNCR